MSLGAGALALKPATSLWHRGEQRYVRWRVGRFVAQAGEAIRAERPQVARTALEAAAVLAPGDWTIRLARTDVLLALGAADEAETLWNRWREELDPNDPRRLPVQYAGKLLPAWRFDILTRLACRQLAMGGPDFGIWLNVAAEAGAMSGAALAEDDLNKVADPAARDVITAYWRARARRFEEAAALLAKVDRPLMRPAVALLSARTWVLAGYRSRARLALAQSAFAVGPLEALAQQPVTEKIDGAAARRIVQALLSPRLKDEAQLKLLLTFLLHGLGDPRAEAAEEILALLRPRASRLDTSQLAAFWLYSGLAGARDAERFWRESVSQRTGVAVPSMSDGGMNLPMARLVLLRVPLPLEFSLGVFSLIAEREAVRSSPPTER